MTDQVVKKGTAQIFANALVGQEIAHIKQIARPGSSLPVPGEELVDTLCGMVLREDE